MKKLLLTASSLIIAANSFGYSKGNVGAMHNSCCQNLIPFIGVQGGWVYDKHELSGAKLNSPWGMRAEMGFDYAIDSSWSFLTSFGGGYYNYYDVTSPALTLKNVAFDLTMGPVVHLDNWYIDVLGGAMAQRFDDKNKQNAATASAATDVSPMIRVGLGYEWNVFQFGVSYTHTFALHGDNDGSFHGAAGSAQSVVAPAMDNVFVGVRYLWREM